MTSFDVALQSEDLARVQCCGKRFWPNDLMRAIELAPCTVQPSIDVQRAAAL
jgi:hypothetical protein